MDTELHLQLGVDAREAAASLGISRSLFLQMAKDGRAPAGVKLARCRRWRVDELKAWMDAGAPPRHRWTWPRRDQE